ncbi:chondroitin sulfate N-acetylgalactosaminyltransferase 1-like isoform X2 [Dysidea avara]|uniref:chondroitin sulfate N-acetylgalactosaminyltransferase 1-like isoform X2 n=1 Tax=Dysidea avara TaxID=196820 RepID=UPI0033181ADE
MLLFLPIFVMQNKLLFALLSILAGSLALLYIFMYTFACRYSNSLICTPFLVHIEFNRYDQYVLQQQEPRLKEINLNSEDTQLFPGDKCSSQVKKLEELRNVSKIKHARDQAFRTENLQLITMLENEIRRVKELKIQNEKLLEQLTKLTETNGNKHIISNFDVHLSQSQFEKAAKEVEKLSVYKYRDPEWVVVPWTVFSSPTFPVYQLEKGISGPPAVHGEPDGRDEIAEVIDAAVNSSIIPSSFVANPQEDNIYARTRSVSYAGTIYDVYYQHKKDDPVFSHARLIKPLGQLRYTKIEVMDKRHVLVNIVLPIKFDPTELVSFVSNFTLMTVPRIHRWQLTVAYYGIPNGAEEMKNVLQRLASEQKYKDYHFLQLPSNYSRVQAIVAGVKSWKRSDILTVVTESHAVFDHQFLLRCVKFAVRGSQVYFPYSFGLYNPNVVYKRKYNFVPSFQKQMVLNVHKGFWLDQDYSTWAAYKSDILSLPGLSELLTNGWYNDVVILRLMAKAGYTIIRAPDRSLFMAWYQRNCNVDQEPEGYYAVCMETNARLMGPPHTLGMILFGIKTKVF